MTSPDQSVPLPLPACSIFGCQSPCQHSPLRSVSHGITVSYMSPDEGKTITVRLDAETMRRLTSLAELFAENDPLEREVTLSQIVRRAISETHYYHLEGPAEAGQRWEYVQTDEYDGQLSPLTLREPGPRDGDWQAVSDDGALVPIRREQFEMGRYRRIDRE